MAVVDDTIVTIALPSIRRELGFSGADTQWVLNGYVLAFGGLLLFCGRAADLWGRQGYSWRVSFCSASRLCSGVFRRRRGFWASSAHCRVSARQRS
jgi:MFS family permease